MLMMRTIRAFVICAFVLLLTSTFAWAQATADDEGAPPVAAVRDAREKAALQLTERHARMLPHESLRDD